MLRTGRVSHVSLGKLDFQEIAATEAADHLFDLAGATVLDSLPAHAAKQDATKKPEADDLRDDRTYAQPKRLAFEGAFANIARELDEMLQ